MKTDFNDFGNSQVAKLPAHLRQFVVSQDYDNYTPVDHAVWRYVMRKNLAYLSKVADASYLKGLEKTGITRTQLLNWFTNARRRIWKPMIKKQVLNIVGFTMI